MTPTDLIRLGLAVCEVATPRTDGTCSCRLGDECPSPGKHPVGRDWLRRAISQRARRPSFVPVHARLAPATSYGLVPVPGSGVIVIDRDSPDVMLPMADTFEVHRSSADPRRGHYYFVLADGISEDEVPRVFAGGEVRVAGSGHVVGPGCRHVSGDLYEDNGADVAYADRDLIEALRALKPVKHGTDAGPDGAYEGARHPWLVGQARKLAGWGWDTEAIAERLRELNETVCVPPLPERSAEFDRMADWASRNVEPDRAPRIRFKSDPDEWEVVRRG